MFRWKNKSIDLENVDKRNLFNNAGEYGLLTLAVGAMAFFGMCQPSQNTSRPKRICRNSTGHKNFFAEFRRSYIQVSADTVSSLKQLQSSCNGCSVSGLKAT